MHPLSQLEIAKSLVKKEVRIHSLKAYVPTPTITLTQHLVTTPHPARTSPDLYLGTSPDDELARRSE